LTFTCHVDKDVSEETTLKADAVITDNTGSGPFMLSIIGNVIAPQEKEPSEPTSKPKPESKVQAGPSRPDVIEVDNDPEDPPITIEKVPNTDHFKLLLNKQSR